MNKYYLLILGVVISIFSVACNKTPNKLVDDCLKAAFSFKEGSYWIYRDSISGEIDSFYVTSLSSQNYTNTNPSFTFDVITTSIIQRDENNPNAGVSTWKIQLEKNTITFRYDIEAQYIYRINYDPINYPFIDGADYGNVYFEHVNLLNNVTISGNNFTSIGILYASSGNGLFNNYFYLNPKIGIVKINQQQGFDSTYKVWEIQRWKIIK